MSGGLAEVHWISDAPTSLHGNGAASFERTTRDPAAVTCRLCRSLLTRAVTEALGEAGAGQATGEGADRG